jgi:hypothetical protein
MRVSISQGALTAPTIVRTLAKIPVNTFSSLHFPTLEIARKEVFQKALSKQGAV